MSVWQFNAALNGYARAHSPGENRLTESERDDIFDWIETANSNDRELSTMTYDWDGAQLQPARRVAFRIG